MQAHPDSLFIQDPDTGRQVYVEKIGEEEPARGWVLLLHGLGDHMGRHGWLKERLLDRGFGVLGIDWPGCGLSEGVRGDLPSMEQARGIIELAIETTEVTLAGVFAHSAGGFFLLRLLAKPTKGFESLKWAWFSSPLVCPDTNHGVLKIAMAHILSRVLPHFTLSTHVRRDDCYHTAPDEEARKLPEGCHDRISLRFGSHLISVAGDEKELATTVPVHLRILLTQGLDDHICPPEFGERLYHALPHRERTFLAAAGARHEPFREPNRFTLLSAIELWLDQQI
ncbi:MAG: alpha/beta fold hydrolase [Verrucomicrobiales bacterium]|nr:alpha/beta fold hydrolase [Verrucomicrobiales bacterium]